MDVDVAFLRKQAAKCRMLASSVSTEGARDTLVGMAKEYEQIAARAEAAPPSKPEPDPGSRRQS